MTGSAELSLEQTEGRPRGEVDSVPLRRRSVVSQRTFDRTVNIRQARYSLLIGAAIQDRLKVWLRPGTVKRFSCSCNLKAPDVSVPLAGCRPLRRGGILRTGQFSHGEPFRVVEIPLLPSP